MTPEELVAAASPRIGAMGSAFYFVPETAARGKELGLDAFRFYFLGRGGVLGDVEPVVVASAFGYFNPDLVTKMWTTAKAVMAPRDAGRAYFEACAEHGRRRFDGVEGLDAFCAAAEAVDAAADPVGLPLYAGIRAEPRADDVAGRAMQLLAVLRELRGSAHLLAVRAAGVEPRTAHFVSRPADGAMFGWGEDQTPTISDQDRAAMVEAERITDRIVTPAYVGLDDVQQQALLGGLDAMEAALAG